MKIKTYMKKHGIKVAIIVMIAAIFVLAGSASREGKAGFVKSNKGLGVVISLALLVIIFLPIILLWLGFGFVINKIKYGKLMK